MMRWLILFTLLASPAEAATPARPCPFFHAGWTYAYTGFNVTSVGYDQSLRMLYVAFGPSMMMFANVPFAVIQGFQTTKNPDALYNSQVYPAYDALFLDESYNCPLAFENLTWCPLLNENDKTLLVNQTGAPLQNETPNCALPNNPVLLWTK